MREKKCITCEEYNDLLKKYEILEKNSHYNNLFYIICLKLSGKQNELETKASKLINKIGYLKALKHLRGAR